MNAKKIVDWLVRAGVEEDIHQSILESLASAEGRYFSFVAPYKEKAPFVMWGVCRSLSWEAERLPDDLRPYDHPISINGDRGRVFLQEDGELTRLRVPLDPTNTELGLVGPPRFYQYWTFKKLSARHWFSRWVWLGILNPAAQAADDQGYFIPKSISVKSYTYETPTEKIVVRFCDWNGAAQLQRTRIFGPFHFRVNLGFKLGSITRIDRVAAVTWVEKGFKIRVNSNFDI